MTKKNDNRAANDEEVVDMYEWLSYYIFEASLVALMGEEKVNEGEEEAKKELEKGICPFSKLLSAFQDFDKALPLALAGCPVDYLNQAKNGRTKLYDIVNECDRCVVCCNIIHHYFLF